MNQGDSTKKEIIKIDINDLFSSDSGIKIEAINTKKEEAHHDESEQK